MTIVGDTIEILFQSECSNFLWSTDQVPFQDQDLFAEAPASITTTQLKQTKEEKGAVFLKMLFPADVCGCEFVQFRLVLDGYVIRIISC